MDLLKFNNRTVIYNGSLENGFEECIIMQK